MLTRQDIRQCVRDARARLYLAGRNDCLRAVAKGSYRSIDDALRALEPTPSEPSSAEVEQVIEDWLRRAAEIRRFVSAHGASWREPVRAQWIAVADKKERNAIALREQAP